MGSLETILAYYNIWAKERDVPKDFLTIRYEDLHADPTGELEKALRFLGVEVAEPHIKEAVAFAAFDNMREMEKRGSRDGSPSEPIPLIRARIEVA